MTTEAVNQFLTKVSQDPKLKDELSQAMDSKGDRQAAVKFAAQHGYNFTSEELGLQLEQMESELNEKELETVAGGKGGNRTSALIEAAGEVAGGILGLFRGGDDK